MGCIYERNEKGIRKPKKRLAREKNTILQTQLKSICKKTKGEDFMNDFSINDMLSMQKELQDKYKNKWEAISPEAGKHKLLWMIGEIGEVVDIIKKNSNTSIIENTELRKQLVEEMADVLMYYNDVLLCYGISEEELKEAYNSKFEKNMKRW